MNINDETSQKVADAAVDALNTTEGYYWVREYTPNPSGNTPAFVALFRVGEWHVPGTRTTRGRDALEVVSARLRSPDEHPGTWPASEDKAPLIDQDLKRLEYWFTMPIGGAPTEVDLLGLRLLAEREAFKRAAEIEAAGKESMRIERDAAIRALAPAERPERIGDMFAYPDLVGAVCKVTGDWIRRVATRWNERYVDSDLSHAQLTITLTSPSADDDGTATLDVTFEEKAELQGINGGRVEGVTDPSRRA